MAYFFLAIIVAAIIFIFINDRSSISKPRISSDIYEDNLDIIYGTDSASLTIFMFSNYDCSFCQKFFTIVYPELKKEYIDNGKVKLVVKPISLSNNESVINSLKIAVCINKYGSLEKLNELLLLEPKVIYTEKFNQVIEELIEKDDFIAECMYGGETDKYISKNLIEFKRLNCTGTPTFIINNKIYKGYVEYDKFKGVVEKELLYSLH